MLRPISRGCALLAGLLITACTNGVAPVGGAAPQSVANHAAPAAQSLAFAKLPSASHVIIIIMENRDYDLVIGSSDAPYINGTLVPEAALMTNSHAIGHPSQPNYLALFSGNTQGITDDSCPHTFTTKNLGSELLAKKLSFVGYSESMPSNGYTGCGSGEYARKHNPWVNFTNIPASSNLIYNDKLPNPVPTVAIIVPNLCNDMHDCSTQTGDTWLSQNVPAILAYNKANKGLLILTWDEADPDSNGQNQIATLLLGPMVKPGSYNEDITHYSVLRTIEYINKLKCISQECQAKYITGIWQ